MGNFIDKTFTVIADILLKVLPASKQEKEAFSYYRAGMSAQSKGRYAEALQNYYEALQVEEDPYDRSYTLYNIGLIYGNTGKYTQALEFYHQALSLNSNLPQALNNIAVIYHSQALRAQSLEEDFHRQVTIELDSKSFQFSKILLNLQLPIEAFDDEPEDDISFYFTEEKLREGVKLALIDMEKYFKN